jgi:hypothetical protein
MLDVPFGRPRDGDALRADPRFAELRAHIWRQLPQRPNPPRPPRRSRERDRQTRHADAARARDIATGARRARAPARRAPRMLQSRIRIVSLAIVLALWQIVGAASIRCCSPRRARSRSRPRHDRQRRVVDLSVAEPGRARDRAHARGVIGVAIGLLLARFWVLDVALGVYITFLYSIPRSRWCR